MTTQSEALRLAEQLEAIGLRGPVAAELRRLQAENAELWKEREQPHKTIEMYVRECNRLEIERDEARRTVREAHEMGTRVVAQRDALLEALKRAEPLLIGPILLQARAVIKMVEEGK